jgi:sugar phosphate isomerase/epimerase
VEREINLSRRKFLGTAAGGAAAAAALSWPASRVLARTPPPRVPKENIGTILFTQRDRISAAPTNAPEVPYGFERVLAALAEQGYKTIEFAGYNQSTQILGRQITPAEIRTILDNNGLNAKGNHGSIPGTLTQAAIDAFKVNCQTALVIGQEYIGTGSDPTGSSFKADWDAAVLRWSELGAIAKAEGLLGVYNHNHDNAYNFLLDSEPLDALGRPTRSSGIRRDEYFVRELKKSDHPGAKYVFMEMDIYWAHVAQHRFQTYTDPDGVVQTNVFDPAGLVAKATHMFPLFHAKDGKRIIDPVTGQPTPPGVGAGYTMVPFGTGDINFKSFFDRIGANRSHYPMYEQDNAPGGSANPGQSLAFSAVSYNNMAALGPVGS